MASMETSRVELPELTEVDLTKRPGVVFNPGNDTWNLPFEGVAQFVITDPAMLFGIWKQKTTGEGKFAEQVDKLETAATQTVRDYVRRYAESQGEDPGLAGLIERLELKPSKPEVSFRSYKVIPWVDFQVVTKGSLTPEQRHLLGDALFPLSYT